MASLETPRTWIPYMHTKNCSQQFCSIYCPQWCSMASPPPPPFDQFSYGNNSTNFSPLVIAIIGILASAFLLVSYYTLISKYCANSNREISHDDHDHHQNEVQLIEDNHNPSMYEPWQAVTTGLEEVVIKAITVCKYKKGDGLIEGSDCSVCLSEFQENESLRLLPKCSHAFHVPCIDTWLKSHSNCPLCRANIVFPIPSLPPLTEIASPLESTATGDHEVIIRENTERVTREDFEVSAHHSHECGPKTPLRVFSDLGDHTMIEMGEMEGSSGSCGQLQMRRSISMDHSCQISCQILRDDQFMVPIDHESPLIVGTSKNVAAGSSSSSKRSKRVLHCVLSSPMSMKRSFPSGRFFLLKNAVNGRPDDVTADPQEVQIREEHA